MVIAFEDSFVSDAASEERMEKLRRTQDIMFAFSALGASTQESRARSTAIGENFFFPSPW